MSALDRVNGTVCDAQQNQQSCLITANTSVLTSGQSIGLAVSVLSSTTRLALSHVQLTAEASFLSLGAVHHFYFDRGTFYLFSAVPSSLANAV